MPLRAIIVDDEPIARKVLREELNEIVDVQVIGEAEDGRSALDQIAERRPDLVFLDLQMPEMGGLEVIRGIRDGGHPPVIIIVTAFDKFALEAFNAGAIDYLVKPVGQKRLADAVERVRRVTEREAIDRFSRLQNFADVAGAGPGPRKIVGKVGEEYFLLAVDEILAFQAEGDLVWIITAPRKYLATQTLKALEQRLAGASFRRIHRSALVNLDHIRKVSALTSQRWLITLSNRQEFVASKRQARGVRGLLRW